MDVKRIMVQWTKSLQLLMGYEHSAQLYFIFQVLSQQNLKAKICKEMEEYDNESLADILYMKKTWKVSFGKREKKPSLFCPQLLADVVEAAVLFLTHTVTDISVWSWLLLSTLRYLAIRHPLFHLQLWQMPYRALSFIIIVSLALNAWLLLAVHSTQLGCIQQALFRSLAWNRLFHIVECAWSFCVPCLLIFIMDISVLIKSTMVSCDIGAMQRFLAQKRSEQTFEPPTIACVYSRNSQTLTRPKHSRTLWRWLSIALICIILNTPENIYRLVILFGMPDVHEEALHFSARMLAQALYFSQFAFNAVYLALFVFDKSTRPK
ncbi:hypothetical protein LOAG_17277 [Loa loa]|uniref:G-protein coupled receptors family 1 profile domain-containing protein n=1 Tax=Loa loa TaxID=7209 RepID=A0A1S0UL76_LOALO|nr:hypothetical protein LOAG_17277 [Loa loa]EJD75597.1 hypothetical protein LOAG_17277 [Loa loa]